MNEREINQLHLRMQTFPDRLRLLVRPVAATIALVVGGHYITKYLREPDLPVIDILRQEADQRARTYLCNGLLVTNISLHTFFTLARYRNWNRFTEFEDKYMVSDVYDEGRTISMCGSAFRHEGFNHLCSNMVLISFFMAAIPSDAYTLSKVYLSGAMISNLGNYAYSIIWPEVPYGCIGSSGAVMAVLGYAVYKYPNFSVPATFLRDAPEISLKPLFQTAIIIEIGLWVTGYKSNTDYISHFFGTLSGLLYGVI